MKNWIIVLFSILFVFSSCSDDDQVNNMGGLRVSTETLNFYSGGGISDINIESNIDPATISYDVASNGKSWCSLTQEGKTLKISVANSDLEDQRLTIVTIRSGNLRRDILVQQQGRSVLADVKVKPVRAEATSFQPEFEIEKTYDDDPISYFNSKHGAISSWPFNLDYYFENVPSIDYIVYYPRQDAGNRWGAFGVVEVWIATEDNPEFEKYGEYDCQMSTTNPTEFTLAKPALNPTIVRFSVKSAYQNRVSCSEVNFMRKNPDNFDYLKIFTDGSCSEIKAGITEADIAAIPDIFFRDLATAIYNKTYDTEFRIQDYRPYENPQIMADKNKTERYSIRDNATGIYAIEVGEEIVVMMGNTHGQKISMVIQDLNVGYNSSTTYPLREGANKIIAKNPGSIYIQNLTDDAIPLLLEKEADKQKAKEKTVRVNFVGGSVNGYFDSQKHTAADWQRILQNAAYQDIDVMGKYVHITWKVADFRRDNTDIEAILSHYDKLVYLEEEFMGLVKYNKMFNNRMYIHIDYTGKSPYATRYRTAFIPSYTEIFTKPNRALARLWGPAHEVGHTNQVRPGVKWAGMTEVTNNIYCLYVQEKLNQPTNLTKDGIYQKAIDGIVKAEQPHCLALTDYSQHMWKLVPFWQLKLYLVDVLGQTDFYKDLYEHYRTTPNLNTTGDLTEGVLQLDFVRTVCNLSKINLLDFFTAWGFLRPVDTILNDYGSKPFKVTQAQIDALKAEIKTKNYPKPAKNIVDITDSNVDLFK